MLNHRPSRPPRSRRADCNSLRGASSSSSSSPSACASSHLQVVDHAHYAQLSVGQVRVDLTTTALRAGIYDRHGQILAISRPTSLVIADDLQISHPAQEAQAMSPTRQGARRQTHRAPLEEDTGTSSLNDQLDLTDGRKSSPTATFRASWCRTRRVRTYPNGTLAESLIGRHQRRRVRDRPGLEYQYQNAARRPDRRHARVRLVLGRQPAEFVQHGHQARPQPGVGLELTIDALAAVRHRACPRDATARDRGGCRRGAIVMDVKTGEILADASLVNTKSQARRPRSDSRRGARSVGVPGIEQTINNLAFTQAYEPGSVFKVVTFSAALQAGADHAVDASSPCPTRSSSVVASSTTPRITPLEHLSATQVLAQSSNIGTYEIGTRVGETGLLAQVAASGFRTVDGGELPGRDRGTARQRGELVRQ